MKKRAFSTLVALSIGALLTGCGSPAQDTAFQPPAGWKSTPGMFGRMQMWMTGSSTSDRQILMIVRGDKNMNTEDIRSTSSPFSGTEKMQDVKRDTITLCGNQKADHFTGLGRGSNGSTHVTEAIEGVTTAIGDSKYFVLYVRPESVQPDIQAENALRSIAPSPK
jgi:hypothetical protein